MSGRPSRTASSPRHPRQEDAGDESKSKRKAILGLLHDAAQIGDADTVKQLLDEHGDIDVNVVRRGRNTTLHTALLHNQEGPVIDYLIRSGADVNAENTKGFTPLTLAIIHCKGSRAVEKLISAGAKWERFESGAFAGMSALDVAVKYKDENSVTILTRLRDGDFCRELTSAELPRGRMICPICNIMVKFPTKMSRIVHDQEAIEKRINKNGDYGTRHRKYVTRKYMDQLLAHSDGRTYKKLCGIEYHGVENMRLRKEISESYGVLHAVQECCVRLGISKGTAPDENVNLQNIFLIDLCSGKGITTALCGALDEGGSNNYFLAVDRLLTHQIPHFLNGEKVKYLCRNIMLQDMLPELIEIVQYQTCEQGRTCILVGMHLCGLLSERAIKFFELIPEISGLVLSPCCLPKRHEQRSMTTFTKGKPPKNGNLEDNDAELYNYLRWADYLKSMVEGLNGSDVANVKLYRDHEMHSEKNAIILGVRT